MVLVLICLWLCIGADRYIDKKHKICVSIVLLFGKIRALSTDDRWRWFHIRHTNFTFSLAYLKMGTVYQLQVACL